MQEQKPRYYLIDGIRGITVVSMVLFHFCYDVFIVFGNNPGWYGNPYVYMWQQSICQTFIFISGLVWQWGRAANLRRGLCLNLLGFALSFITLVFMPTEVIWFGILNFLGCAVLLMFPLEKAAEKIPSVLGLGVCIFCFIFFKNIQYKTLGLGDVVQIHLPDFLYSIKILTPLGFPYPGFVSSDFFPILPWMFLYLGGYFFGRIFMEHSGWHSFACKKIPFFSALGRRAIWVYLFHQPVCMLVCMFIFMPL